MTFSPFFIIIALGCFAGAVLMFTKLRNATPISIPTGILMVIGGIYLLCREFVDGFSENQTFSWVLRGLLVVFLIYIFLTYNNMRAEQIAEFDEPQVEGANEAADIDKGADMEEAPESEEDSSEPQSDDDSEEDKK